MKRKADEQTVQEGRKPKKRRLERVVGWEVSDSQEKPLDSVEPGSMKEMCNNITGA